MKTLLAIALALSAAGCTTAKVLYSTPDSIGVRYMDAGVFDDGGDAMALVAKHCPEGFEITNRASHDRDVIVDARCK